MNISHRAVFTAIVLLTAVQLGGSGQARKAASNLDTALIHAVIAGKIDLVKKLLEHGADGNTNVDRPTTVAIGSSSGVTITASVGGWTPLMWASSKGYSDIVTLLLKHKAAVNVSDRDGKTALTIAAYSGYTPIIEQLLNRGANIEAHETISGGSTPLVLAAENGHTEAVELLLSRHANPNATGSGKQTALMWAVVGGYRKIAWLLLRNGADPNLKGENGQTALTRAGKSSAMTTLLRQFGATQ